MYHSVVALSHMRQPAINDPRISFFQVHGHVMSTAFTFLVSINHASFLCHQSGNNSKLYLVIILAGRLWFSKSCHILYSKTSYFIGVIESYTPNGFTNMCIVYTMSEFPWLNIVEYFIFLYMNTNESYFLYTTFADMQLHLDWHRSMLILLRYFSLDLQLSLDLQ